MTIRKFGIEWRWDLLILILASWLIGTFCTWQIVHALHVHTADTNQLLSSVANELAKTNHEITTNNDRTKELIDRFERVEADQKVMRDEDRKRLEQLKDILKQLKKEK